MGTDLDRKRCRERKRVNEKEWERKRMKERGRRRDMEQNIMGRESKRKIP